MRASLLVLLIASYSCFIDLTLGALSFTKTPTAPKALVNPLVLTCSIEPTNNNGPVSVTIGKGTNTVIANMNQQDKTQINFGNAGYSVEGLLSNTGASYIKITWQRPSRFESGTYYCAITAKDASGTITPQRSTLSVSIQKPAFEDLLAYSRKQGDLIEEQSSLIQDHSKQLKDIQERLKTTTTEIAETKTKVTGIAPRVEEGFVLCGNSQTYTILPQTDFSCQAPREKRISVVFSKPFATVPSITLYANLVDIAKDKGVRLSFWKQNVSVKGFEIVCGTWCDTLMYELAITWQARNN